MSFLVLLSALALLNGPAHAIDDVAGILNDLTSDSAPCAGEIDRLDAAVAADARDLRARRARGVCHYRLGRLEMAWDDLVVGLERQASEPEPLVVGAILAARRGDADQSAVWLTQARASAGRDHPQVLRGEIIVLGASGRLPQAWQELDAALQNTNEDPVLRVAATELVALDPDNATPLARAAIGRRVQTVTRHNRASTWLNGGQPAACLHEADNALAEADPKDTDAIHALHELAWRCAVAAGQVGPATRHLKVLGLHATAGLPSGAMIAHVRLMRDAGQTSTALKMVRLVTVSSDVDRRDLATLKVGLYRSAGDLDAALAAATESASPVQRATLAKDLVAAGRTVDAVTLLERTCSAMDDADARTCTDWRDRLQKSLSEQ